MRNDLTHIEEVERYLLGEMDAAEKSAFEARMQSDNELKQDVALQQQLMERINFNGFRADMLAMHDTLAGKPRKGGLNMYFLAVLIALGIGIVAGIVVWVTAKPGKMSEPDQSGFLPGQRQTVQPAPDTLVQAQQRDTVLPEKIHPENVISEAAEEKASYGPEVSFDRFLPQFHKEITDNDRDFTFRMADSKSLVHVPADCMLYPSGEDVTGPVEIRYREYRDAAQIAFSQIPMIYRENNILYNFNSAGMFELRAYQNGEELQLKADKPIVVDYNATEQLDNCYFFQLKDQAWRKLRGINFRQLAEDGFAGNEKKKDSSGVLLATIRNTSTGANILNAKIEMWIDGKKVIERAELVSEGYVVKNLKQATYTAQVSCPGFVSQPISEVKVAWDSLSGINVWLKPIPKKQNWVQRMVTSLQGSKRRNQARESGYTVDPKLKIIPDTYKPKEYKQTKAIPLLTGGGDPGHTYPNLVKGLNCPEFGVYNCDQIYVLADRINMEASYQDEAGKPISGQHVLSLVDLNYNGAFSFSPAAFSCSASGRNVLLLFTRNGHLYALNETDFKSMNITKSGKQTFTMTDITNEVKSTDDLRAFLGLKAQ